MTFAQFATYLQKLEATSSRNQMVEILADLFLQVSPKEAQEIAYLSQGRIAPLFEPLEFGMADNMVLRAMGEAFEVSSQEAEKLFKSEGDLGKAAEKLSLKFSTSPKAAKSTVSEVFETLLKIAKFSGAGSVGQKASLLADLLKRVD